MTRLKNIPKLDALYFFYPDDWLKLYQETNNKIFSGFSTTRKVFSHNGVLH